MPPNGVTAAPEGSPLSQPTPTPAAASRLLAQATYGATLADIERVQMLGFAGWVDEQLKTPGVDTHLAYVLRKGPIGCNPCDSIYINAVMESFWRQAVTSPDQLRQRAVFALSQIFVVSTVNSSIDIQADAHGAYLDLLSKNAFGNFRTLLEDVSLSPTMGRYLSHLKNQKEDPASGRIPDQNYAREIMQLFSIGLWELNPDGSKKRDANGKAIPTYGQAEITAMSRVFTGWGWGGQPATADNWEWGATDNWTVPMQAFPDFHSSSEKRIINGVVIPAGTGARASLTIALDTLFNHPNVGPFIGQQLIQRLVTSNPSPAYVTRVGAAFNNNGQGVRGDMRAVWRAVLLDPEARDIRQTLTPSWGKLREPMLRYGQFLRSFDVKSDSGKYAIWNLEDLSSSLGQNPLRAPSVFNWYRPDYSPTGAIQRAGLKAPEFQITHETTATGYTNFIADKAERETTRFKAGYVNDSSYRDFLATSYAAQMPLADRPELLVDQLNLVLMAGQMSPVMRARVLRGISAVVGNDETNRMKRVSSAVTLIMASPEYVIQK